MNFSVKSGSEQSTTPPSPQGKIFVACKLKTAGDLEGFQVFHNLKCTFFACGGEREAQRKTTPLQTPIAVIQAKLNNFYINGYTWVSM